MKKSCSEGNTKNININVHVYTPGIPWVQRTVEFTPLVLEHSFIWLHAFSAAGAYHNKVAFLCRLPIDALFDLCASHLGLKWSGIKKCRPILHNK